MKKGDMQGFWGTVLSWWGLAPYSRALELEDTIRGNELRIDRIFRTSENRMNEVDRLRGEVSELMSRVAEMSGLKSSLKDGVRVWHAPDSHNPLEFYASLRLNIDAIDRAGLKVISEMTSEILARTIIEARKKHNV